MHGKRGLRDSIALFVGLLLILAGVVYSLTAVAMLFDPDGLFPWTTHLGSAAVAIIPFIGAWVVLRFGLRRRLPAPPMALSPEVRTRLLREELGRSLPEALQWPAGEAEFGEPTAESDIWLETPPREDNQRLSLLLRRDGEVQFGWRLPDGEGEYEQLFIPSNDDELRECLRDAVKWLADIRAERMAIIYDDRFLQGGRDFVPVEALDAARGNRHIAWIASWRGTCNWKRP